MKRRFAIIQPNFVPVFGVVNDRERFTASERLRRCAQLVAAQERIFT